MADNMEKTEVRKLDVGRFKAFQEAGRETDGQCPPKPPRAQNKALQKYGKLKIFQEPVQLISADDTKHLRYNEDAIVELMKIDHTVNVVTVVGKYRTGKSLLLNRLAGINKAFRVGSTHNAMTKGVWLFCRPHPTQESQILVLLDTEGLDDALKENMMEEQWHFVLTTLLSSTLVYNHKGTLDAGAIKKLKFLKNIKTTINVLESEQGDDSFFDVFFPTFIVAVRDNALKTTDQDGKSISPDQFLENVLVLKRGTTDSVRKFNEPRLLVRRYFKERKCFMFSPPRYPERLDEGKIQQNTDFERDADDFLKYVYDCKPKRMTSGKVLNGRMFGSLVRSYTRFIQEEKTPCLHEAAKEMIEYENQNILKNAENVYKKEMQRLIGGNLPNLETMGNLHVQCMEKAIEYLRRNIIYDDIQLFLETAKDSFIEILNKLKKAIAKDSEQICWDKLQYMDATRIGKKIKMRTYEHVAGYDEYIADIEWIIKQYNKTTGLGPKMRQVLQDYLDGKEREEETVYQMVQKAQEESGREKEGKTFAAIKRTPPRQLSNPDESKSRTESGVSDDLLKLIMEDQKLQKQDMSASFFSFMKLKISEYERQLVEGADSSAAVTKQENDRFKETFLEVSTSEPTGPRPVTIGDEKPKPSPKTKKCKIL